MIQRKISKTKYIIFVVIISFGIFFVVDPFKWWPIEVGNPCTSDSSDSLRPTCTGKIIFPWQRP